MKEHQQNMKAAIFGVIFSLLCSCTSINKVWDDRVGTYSYQEAIQAYGPPDQKEQLANGNQICSWTLARGAAWVDKLILMFNKKGILVSGGEKRY